MRLELNQRTDLALRLLQVLDEAGGRLKAQDLADRAGSTAGFVPQVLAPLVAKGWIDSQPGPTGGYRIVSALGAISLLELIEASEGPTDAGQCVLVPRPCQAGGRCALHDPWTRAREALVAELSLTPLSAIPAGTAPPGEAGP